ncbi:uncharacterized protein [Temnothorax nylanderi]|uniref:uncharacterized protein n=1 Tax=Temnothorax nylanderi TaxID=102681 RepID=UPI003A8B88D1
MESMEELLAAQTSTQTLIIRILTNFNKLAKAKKTVPAVRSRINSLKGYWDVIQVNHAKLCALADEGIRQKEEYFQTDKFLSISDSVEEIMDVLLEYLERLQPETAQTNFDGSIISHEARSSIVQLPRIDIPKFSGELTKWENFRDVFESLVANRTDLTNVQKLHYLKANLSGAASLILSNTHVTDANYNTAWELLRKRYDNPRAIVNAHLQAFMDIPCVSAHSVSNLENLRDKTNDIYTALLNLKRPVNQWEDLMLFVAVSKLDKDTRRDWELSLGDAGEIPSIEELDAFLTSRIRALKAVHGSSQNSNKSANKTSNVKAHQVSTNNGKCLTCEGNHPLNHCKTFLNQSVPQRVEVLKKHKCCFNCLRQGHLPWTCKSKNVCTLCKRKHHTLIHREKDAETNETPASTSKDEQNVVTTSNLTSTQEERSNEGVVSSNNFSNTTVNTTLLPTASVLLKNKSGRSVRIRALLDQGSQASFVTESVVQLLGAERERVSIQVSGIGGSKAGSSESIASFTVEPCSQGGPVLPFKAFVLPKLTNYLPQPTMLDETCRYLSSLDLADSEPSNEKGIDLLIGTDYYGAVLRDGLIHGPPGGPIAQLTIFGWVVSGPIQDTSQTVNNYHINVNHGVASDSLHESLRSFWELEEVPCGNLLSEEDIRCEAHFVNTHSRLPDGRYVVRLPFKTDPPIPLVTPNR